MILVAVIRFCSLLDSEGDAKESIALKSGTGESRRRTGKCTDCYTLASAFFAKREEPIREKTDKADRDEETAAERETDRQRLRIQTNGEKEKEGRGVGGWGGGRRRVGGGGVLRNGEELGGCARSYCKKVKRDIIKQLYAGSYCKTVKRGIIKHLHEGR